MLTFNIHDAKTHLSKLVDQAASGESFIIAKAGKPMVKVIPLSRDEAMPCQRLGFMSCEIRVPDDFDLMGAADIQNMFEGDK
jgi:prevent-host-death family protein